MATYLELHELHSDADLRARVEVAVVDVADGIIDEIDTTPNHTNRLLWSKEALYNAKLVADRMYPAVLVSSKSKTVAEIQALTDANIRNKIGRLIDLFATGPGV